MCSLSQATSCHKTLLLFATKCLELCREQHCHRHLPCTQRRQGLSRGNFPTRLEPNTEGSMLNPGRTHYTRLFLGCWTNVSPNLMKTAVTQNAFSSTCESTLSQDTWAPYQTPDAYWNHCASWATINNAFSSRYSLQRHFLWKFLLASSSPWCQKTC